MNLTFKLFIAGLLIARYTWGGTSGFIKISPDSLKEFSNLKIQSSGRILNDDSLYCDKLVFKNDAPLDAKGTAIASKYLCNDLEVTEFTFFGYQDDFVLVLFKPNGSKEAYFGKARIKKTDIANVYRILNEDAGSDPMSERKFESISKTTGIATLVIVAVATLVFSVLVLAAGLATIPFK